MKNNFCVCLISRAVKMARNPRANPAHQGFGPGWIENFYKFQYMLTFDSLRIRLTRVEPVMSRVDSPTRK